MKKITNKKSVKISKEVLKYLLLAGALYVAASSPYFALNLSRNISKLKGRDKRKINSAFQYLKSRDLIRLRQEKYDIQIILTEKGKKRAEKHQINDLKIEAPKKWDKKWRVISFDIPDLKRVERNAFRAKLKEFGFYSLQKSVWVYPFDCHKEIGLLREFFGVNQRQICLITAEKIEGDEKLKQAFKL